MRYLAVDPGNVTGVAGWDGESVFSYQEPALKATTLVKHTLNLWGSFYYEVTVVCESFVPRPGAKSFQPDAMYTIGALRFVCWELGVPFELQTPAAAKSFSTDAKLKRVGWYKTTEGGHENDARRHLLLALVKNREIELESLL